MSTDRTEPRCVCSLLMRSRCNHIHAQALLVDPSDYLVTIDVDLVVAITRLWAAGVTTTFSCRGVDTLEEFLAGAGGFPGTRSPYIQFVDSGNSRLAARVLRDLGMPWGVEPAPPGQSLKRLLPEWMLAYHAGVGIDKA